MQQHLLVALLPTRSALIVPIVPTTPPLVVEAHPTDEHSSVPVDYIDNDVAGSLMGTAYTDGRRNDDQTQVPLVTIAHPYVDSFL